MPRIGALRDRVVIQQKSSVDDGQGGRSVSWGTLATVWGDVQPLQADERIQAAAIGSSVAYRIETRYRADVTAKMRALWTPYGGSQRTLEVHSVTLVNGRPHRMGLECSEVV